MPQARITPSLAASVLGIAREAGLAIMTIYSAMRSASNAASVMVSHKKDDSPLTQADLAAHRVIADALKRLTPDIPVVSEEDEASLTHRQPTGDFWLIDPLDGTKEFLAQSDEFTVNIALVQNGSVTFGVVVAPALDLAYWGGVGMNACREKNGATEIIKVSPSASGQPIRVVASKDHMNPETASFIARLGKHQLVQAGSSLKFCRIAEGNADVYPRLGPTSEWDTAAAQAVVEAAGGYVTTLGGEPLRYGRPDLLNPHFVVSAVPLSGLVTPPSCAAP